MPRSRRNNRQGQRLVLGVAAGRHALHAALVRPASGGEGAPPQVLRAFAQGLSSAAELAAPAYAPPAVDLAYSGDGHGGSDGQDYTIRFGPDAAPSIGLFMESEFGGLDVPASGPAAALPTPDLSAPAAPSQAPALAAALRGVIDACRQHDGGALEAACLLRPDEADYTELVVPAGKAPTQRQLLARLKAEQGAGRATGRVRFVEMTPGADGSLRYLAVAPRGEGELVEALSAAVGPERAAAAVLESEVEAYAALARTLSDAAGTAAIVRVGEENTLALFLEDGRIRHLRLLPSLTTFDAPERIGRRVLLEQDESGIERVDRIWVAAGWSEEAIVAEMQACCEGAVAASLRRAVAAADGLELDEEPAAVAAVGAALQAARKAPRRRGPVRRLSAGRPGALRTALLVGLVLAISSALFVLELVRTEHRIEAAEEHVLLAPPPPAEAQALRQRVDSLQAAYMAYTQATARLDSVLTGSDGWSRALDRVARDSRAARGVWIESWRPAGAEIKLAGNAVSRDAVVDLATRLEATIESVTYTEIREWPVYAFTLRIPFPNELPEAARHLRETAAAAPDAPTETL